MKHQKLHDLLNEIVEEKPDLNVLCQRQIVFKNEEDGRNYKLQMALMFEQWEEPK